tara:strand:- start:1421 stop:2308 length:888 start_codon:yes stop_codon:yes gene_type:complete
MKEIVLAMLCACSQDVSILKLQDAEASDTAIAIVDTNESEPTNEPEEVPTELNGNVGYVNYYLRQVACPACVGEPQELTVEFKAKFFENTNQNHTEWIPQIGTCTDQLLITVPSTNAVDMGQSLTVKGSPNQFSVIKQGSEYVANVYESMYDRDTTHTVEFDSDQESFDFISIRGFDTLEPYTMLYVDPSYAFAAPIYKSGMTFSWTPYGSDSNFMITIAVYTPDGSQLLGYTACSAPDQGFMTIPGQHLQQYPVWSLAAIHMARHRVEHVPYQPLGGYIESHMEWEVVGTGHIE